MMESTANLNRYTVVGVCDQEGETITEHVMADSPEGAITAYWETRDEDDTGMSVVDVFEGHVDSVMPHTCWVDHPGKSEED